MRYGITAGAIAVLLATASSVRAEEAFPFGTIFVAESLNGKPFSSVTRPNLSIDRNQKLSGRTGCNSFFGAALFQGGGLSFSGVGMTRVACFGSAAETEKRFLQALSSVNGWEMRGKNLVLVTSSGVLLMHPM